MSSTRKLLRSNFLLILFIAASCSPPDDPVKCSTKDSDCTITNCYGMFPDRSTCRAGNVAYPGTEEEIVSIVSAATKAGKKMKVVTSFAHSIPKLACPDGVDGLLISTKYLNHVVNVDAAAMTMTVESGMALSQLIEEAAKAGLALPYAPYWSGATIGGILSTGSHGSSLWGKGSAVHDYVIGMRIVSPGGPDEGYAKIRILNESHEDLNAAKVSLGVLGVISQHEFADMSWYPSQRQVVYRVDDRVSPDVSGEGLYDFTGFRDTLSLVAESIRTTEETQESNGLDELKCVSAGVTTTILGAIAYGLTNNGIIFTGYPVIGYQNRLQSSSSCVNSPEDGLITACPWDPRIKGEFFHQTTFKISLSVVQSFIEDVQSLVALEPKSLCGLELYNGILMRYVKASSAYLGSQEDALDFDITYYRSKDPLTPRLYEDILEEIEQMAVFKYGGLPHWGKNRNIAFDGVFKKYRNVTEFLKFRVGKGMLAARGIK
ncbi:hypothetical protein SLEP1_g561 [Rubroshorea leprosula]|uniref:L-gulonolactone oxidase n=1 Tax=Rubroshorea leprosula TaxID=152421 RepID=A0AAV5HJN0_9ROSI|nr:hypothetical protein SLEP1_g561 [Rubroshorea leprosula]